MMDEEGNGCTRLFHRGCIEKHSGVVVDGDGDDCMKADVYVRGGVLLVEAVMLQMALR